LKIIQIPDNTISFESIEKSIKEIKKCTRTNKYLSKNFIYLPENVIAEKSEERITKIT